MSDPTFTTPPTAPTRQSPATFSARMDAFLAWLVAWVAELTTAVAWFRARTDEVAADTAAAANSATQAAASASTAVSGAGVSAWVSAGSYTVGDLRYSPATFQTYRATTTHSGLTDDPSVDGTNWVRISAAAAQAWFTASTAITAEVGDAILADTSGGAFTITLPAVAVLGDTVAFADPGANWGTNSLTVSGNGKNVDGASTFAGDVNEGYFLAIYNGTAWQVRFAGGAI